MRQGWWPSALELQGHLKCASLPHVPEPLLSSFPSTGELDPQEGEGHWLEGLQQILVGWRDSGIRVMMRKNQHNCTSTTKQRQLTATTVRQPVLCAPGHSPAAAAHRTGKP